MVWLLYILSSIFPNCIQVWPVRDHYEVGRAAIVIVGSQRKHLDPEITVYLTKLKYAQAVFPRQIKVGKGAGTVRSRSGMLSTHLG
jgi:hypothetical protein